MDLAATLGSRLLVIYDGHCGLCNHTVQWLIARDRHDRLRFAPSSSPALAALLTRQGFPPAMPDNPNHPGAPCPDSGPWEGNEFRLSMGVPQSGPTASAIASNPASGPGTILVFRAAATPAEQLFTRSAAVAVVLAELPRPWPLAARLLRLIPHPVRDLAYRLIARWRYRIWGRLSACPLPTPQQRSRFL